MEYTDFSALRLLFDQTEAYAALSCEYGEQKRAKEIESRLLSALEEAKAALCALPSSSPDEPDDYAAILALSEGGNRIQMPSRLSEKMAGAVLGRFAGCLLGVPVELWSIDDMKKLAAHCKMEYPPKTYWREVDRPWGLQYQVDPRENYTEGNMNAVCVDDDITYTILGLLLLERYGFGFTTADVGEYWKEYLPYACTAEAAALENLRGGTNALCAAQKNNPYVQWIGALIRADGFAFACAGDPHLAASLAYRDAYLTHRRNGIYGEMFFAALEAAAFTCETVQDAILCAKREIPKTCALSKDVLWALETAPTLTDYESARRAVDAHFPGMNAVHTENNACLILFALLLSGGSFEKAISDAVAMGLDNDCTGATVGSIMGAMLGKSGIPEKFTEHFGDTIHTYLKGSEHLSISDVIARFVFLATTRPQA